MDHANVQIIGIQIFQAVFKTFLYLVDITGGLVLAIAPDGAQMGLENEVFPVVMNGGANSPLQLGVGAV